MKIAIIQFPASNCDFDTLHALKNVLHADARLVWHKEFDDTYDAAILPGGFSYGDFLRAGIIAAYSPAMKIVKEMAREGKPVLGICNGFQTLCEAGLLQGALLRNAALKFVCAPVILKVITGRKIFGNPLENGKIIRLPIAHGEGRYFNDERALRELHENDQVVFKYVDENWRESEEANPNGSLENIAGICNREGNVLGLMPHPERASESILRSEDGKTILKWLINAR
ncbi:MAG: phosphoribosylformylglycinamidine synthase I [Candidatus Micrarchaeota archaeon]